jgi:nitrite reductase/ring-hydroxylating ferredoxin subunit
VSIQQHSEDHIHVVCPWHGYEFDLLTGLHPGGAGKRLRRADLKIMDDEIYVVI